MFCFKQHRRSGAGEGASSGDAFTLGFPGAEKGRGREAMNCPAVSKRPGRTGWLHFQGRCFPSCISSKHLSKVKRHHKAEALTGTGVCGTEGNQGNLDSDDGQGTVLPCAAESDSLMSTVFKSERRSLPDRPSVQFLPEQAAARQTKVVVSKDWTAAADRERWEALASGKSRTPNGELLNPEGRELVIGQKKNRNETDIKDPISLPAADFPYFLTVLLSEGETYVNQKTARRGESSDSGVVKDRNCDSLPAARFTRGESVSGTGFQGGFASVELRTEEGKRETPTVSDFGLHEASTQKWDRVFHGEYENCLVERSKYQYECRQDGVSDEDTFVSGEEPCDEKHTGPTAACAGDDWSCCRPIDTNIFDLPGSLTEPFRLCSAPSESSGICCTVFERSTCSQSSTREDVFASREDPLACQRKTPSVPPPGEGMLAFGPKGFPASCPWPVEGRERESFSSLREKDEMQKGRQFHTAKRMLRTNAEEMIGRKRVRIRGVCRKRYTRIRCGEHDMKEFKSRERKEDGLSDLSRKAACCSRDDWLQTETMPLTPHSYRSPSQNSTSLFSVSRSSCSSRHTQTSHPWTVRHHSGGSQKRLTALLLPRDRTVLSSSERKGCPSQTDFDDEDVPFSPSFCVFVSPEDTTGPEEGEAQRPLSCQETSGFTPFATGDSGRMTSEVPENVFLPCLHNRAESLCSSGSNSVHCDEEPHAGTDLKGPSVSIESAQSEVPDYCLRQRSEFPDGRKELSGTTCVMDEVAGNAGSVEADREHDEREHPSSSDNKAGLEVAASSREGVRGRREKRSKRRRLSLTTVSDPPPLYPETLAPPWEKGELTSASTNHHRRPASHQAAVSVEGVSCSRSTSHRSAPKDEDCASQMQEDGNQAKSPSQPETLLSTDGGRSQTPEAENKQTWTETERFISVVGEGLVSVLGRGAETLQNILVESLLQSWVEEPAGAAADQSLEDEGTRDGSCTKPRRRKRPLADFSCSSPYSCNREVTCLSSSFSSFHKDFCKKEAVWGVCGGRRDECGGTGLTRSPVCFKIDHREGAEAIMGHFMHPTQDRERGLLHISLKKVPDHSSSSFPCYISPQKRLLRLQCPSSSPLASPCSRPAQPPNCFFPLQAVPSSVPCISRAVPRATETGEVPCSPVPSFLSPTPAVGEPSETSACLSAALPRATPHRENGQQQVDRPRNASRPVRGESSSLRRAGRTAPHSETAKLEVLNRCGSSEFSSLSWPAETRKSCFRAPCVDGAGPSPSLVANNSRIPGGKRERTYKEEISAGVKFDPIRAGRRLPHTRGERYWDFRSTLRFAENNGRPAPPSSSCLSFSSFSSASPSTPYSAVVFGKPPVSSPPFASPSPVHSWPSGGRQMKQKRTRGKALWIPLCPQPIPVSRFPLSSRGCGYTGAWPTAGERKTKASRPSPPFFLERIQKPSRFKEVGSPGGVIPTSPWLFSQLNARVQPNRRFVASPNTAPAAVGIHHRRESLPGRIPHFQRIADCRRIKPVYTYEGRHLRIAQNSLESRHASGTGSHADVVAFSSQRTTGVGQFFAPNALSTKVQRKTAEETARLPNASNENQRCGQIGTQKTERNYSCLSTSEAFNRLNRIDSYRSLQEISLHEGGRTATT
ncbi:hypothetical protein NCLIV_000200 [Neospora caninum Liverpool]|uniref:Uncharacterized protein n=1 Tax=Neospora caninum (strain Liverpool) TaxID=572307 RepID=F0V731_NEOCL|nr:hypothetical protein NCLIV_000200 [Neospora caninum Liverpool]CBZ49522.1 hypothetical protein NCLIV_000200 [Neospora caninum Liverpool]CEL64101.1 TPA: hypothetical protein BN1204_000200 [Neospora caninum Liverpool]|eukprot:XP_003879557.1 hypothetical protein NCLIV_000200 [Neospora caninum Liverpool]